MRGRLRFPSLFACVPALLVLAWSARGSAADSNAQIAQSLFDDARALLDAGRYSEACPKLAESQRLDPGGGTLLNLALCHEGEGKTATAWLEFREALAQAARNQREDRAVFARAHIADLEPKLVRISVVVPPTLADPALEVRLDHSSLPRAAWGTSLPVDPGEHRIVATSGKTASWETTIHADTPGHVYEVAVARPVAEARSPEPTVRRRSLGFWIALSGAGALAVTSAVTGIVALEANGYLKDHCSTARDFCWVSDADEARSRAHTFAWASTATLGGALVAASVAFLLPLETRAGRITAGVIADDKQAFGVLRLAGM